MAEGSVPPEPAVIHVVGPFRVARGGHALPDNEVGSRKGRTLLKLLAARQERSFSADEIADVLWPEGPPPRAEQNVASLISRLRGVLGADVVAGGRAGYRLGDAPEVDVDRAERLIAESRARLAASEPALAVAAARRALDLLSGHALEGEPDAEWVDDVRAHVDRLRRDARRAVWESATEAGDPASARAAAEDAVMADPLDEEAARALMTAHHMGGNDAGGLAVFDRLREDLAEELGADPSPETRELHVALLRGDRLEGGPGDAASDGPPGERPGAERPASADAGFVGRDRELDQLSGTWSEAASGTTSFVLLVGEAGIGKSRLAQEVVALAAGTGGFVAQARCYEAERSLFLQPVSDAVRSLAASAPPDILRRAAGPEAGALGIIVPEIAAILRPHGYQPAEAEIERRRSFEAVRSFLVALGEQSPVLLYLDDLHNAGSSTLEFLHFLGRRTTRARLTVLATVRVEEGDEVLDQLGDVARRVEVGPLPPDAVGELARLMGAAASSERLLEATKGHTLSVVESLRALSEGTDPADIPRTLADAVLARLRRLGPEVEETLEVAAVLGSSIDPDVTANVLEAPVEEVVRRIEVARRGRLVQVAENSYAFANDLIREIVYGAMAAPARTARHRRAAALSAENPEAVARHATAAGDWDMAFDAWLGAGRRAAERFANRDAKRMFDRALAAAELGGDGRREALARVERGRILEALADFDGAYRDHVAALVGARAAGDRHLEMRVEQELGSDPPIGIGRPAAEAVPHLEAALGIAEELDDVAGQVAILSRLAILSTNRLRFPAARDQARRAVRLARGLGDDRALVSALDGLKSVAAYDGDLRELESVIPELERLARRTGRLFVAHWTVFESAFVPMARGMWTAAVAGVRSALELNRRVGYSANATMFLSHLGWIHHSRGRYAQAVAVGRQALVHARGSDHPWWHSFSAALFGWTLTEVGNLGEAIRVLESGLESAERDGAEMYLVRCLGHLALARALAGDAPEAERHLQAAERILSYASHPPESNFLHGAPATLAAARAALVLGSPARSAVLAEPVLRAAGTLGWVEPEAEAALVLARCRLGDGRHGDAAELATRAVRVAEDSGLGRLRWEAHAVRSHAWEALGLADEAKAERTAAAKAAAAAAATLAGAARTRFLSRTAAATERPEGWGPARSTGARR